MKWVRNSTYTDRMNQLQKEKSKEIKPPKKERRKREMERKKKKKRREKENGKPQFRMMDDG